MAAQGTLVHFLNFGRSVRGSSQLEQHQEPPIGIILSYRLPFQLMFTYMVKDRIGVPPCRLDRTCVRGWRINSTITVLEMRSVLLIHHAFGECHFDE